MKKFISLIAVFIFLPSIIFSQDLRSKAENDPLSCALYKFSKNNRDNGKAHSLMGYYYESERFDDLLNVIDLWDSSEKTSVLAGFAEKLFVKNKFKEATKLLVKTLSIMKSNEESDTEDARTVAFIASMLVKLNYPLDVSDLIKNQEENDDKCKILFAVADALQETNRTDKALIILKEILKYSEHLEDPLTRLDIAALEAKLNRTGESERLLAQTETEAATIDSDDQRRDIYFKLISVYFQIGQGDKAFELWQQHGDSTDFYDVDNLMVALWFYKDTEKAAPYLFQIRQNHEYMKNVGSRLVRYYIKFNDLETAVDIAKKMNDADDNSLQQSALMSVADRFISDGNKNSALDILEFAFQRAKKVIFEHEDLQSNGSPGTLKVSYLRNIYQRLMKLKQYNKAYTVINAIGSDHWIAKTFVMEGLADLIKQQAKILSRKEIDKILSQIQNSISDKYKEENTIQAKLFTAEIYAQIGEKTKAVELLTKVLEEDPDFFRLLSAGRIFEQNNLQADAKMKKILLSCINEN